MRQWPDGCYDKSSCARHKACMYLSCKHQGKDIKNDVEYRLAVDKVNRMHDDGTVSE